MESHGHQSGTAAYCAGKLAEMEGAAKAMRTHYERELMDAQDYEGELLDAQEQYGVALAILARELKTARAQRDQQWTWLLFFVVLALLEAVAIVLHVAPAIDAWRRL
jgi:t-SNARE complex subunit (syntaxin)